MVPVAPPVIVLLAGLLVIPLAAVIGIGLWTRGLRRRGTVPRFAIHTAYGFVVLSGAIVAVAAGLVLVALAGRGGDTAVKRAAALATGISEALNNGALGLLVAMVGAAWLGFCTWRWRKRT